LSIAIQIASDCEHPPTDMLESWALCARKYGAKDSASKSEHREILLRIVDKTEMLGLNANYREKAKVTNVLSFPADIPELPAENIGDESGLPMGDIVICAPIIMEEANDQSKSVTAHWCHMVVHGVLHLYDFDHNKDSDAITMEALEIKILAKLGYPNPYQVY
jgi:probable rRNA maturation factor